MAKFIALEAATREQFLTACKHAGLDEVRGQISESFDNAAFDDNYVLTVREVQAMIAKMRSWGIKSIDITDPYFIRTSQHEPTV